MKSHQARGPQEGCGVELRLLVNRARVRTVRA
jgi:hypothetical protein